MLDVHTFPCYLPVRWLQGHSSQRILQREAGISLSIALFGGLFADPNASNHLNVSQRTGFAYSSVGSVV